MLKYELYVKDIKRAIRLIEKSIKDKTYVAFSHDDDCVDSNALRLQIISESLKKLPADIWSDYFFEVARFIDFRNMISPRLLWDILTEKIPLLKSELQKASRSLQS